MNRNEKVGETLTEGPTYELIDKSIYNLYKSIDRFEEILAIFEGQVELRKEVESEKHDINVVGIYKQVPKRISTATDRIYQLIDRLQNQFS